MSIERSTHFRATKCSHGLGLIARAWLSVGDVDRESKLGFPFRVTCCVPVFPSGHVLSRSPQGARFPLRSHSPTDVPGHCPSKYGSPVDEDQRCHDRWQFATASTHLRLSWTRAALPRLSTPCHALSIAPVAVPARPTVRPTIPPLQPWRHRSTSRCGARCRYLPNDVDLDGYDADAYFESTYPLLQTRWTSACSDVAIHEVSFPIKFITRTLKFTSKIAPRARPRP